jgi:hemerythrin superfamily protein
MAKKSAAKKTAAKRSTTKRAPARAARGKPRSQGQDAISLLKTDHEKVQSMFDRYDKTRSEDNKRKLAEQICTELTLHAQVEEEIFYPAVKAAIKETELIAEAGVEHKSAKDLMAEIQASSPADELYDARVKVLGEYVKHHIKEEQGQIFPAARKAGLDLKELGGQIAQRKKALSGETKAENAGTSRGVQYPFPMGSI